MRTLVVTTAVATVISVLSGGAADAGPDSFTAADVPSLAAASPLASAPGAEPRHPPPLSPVADAAMRSDLEAVRALVRQGADVNAAQGDGMTALHWAAQNGDLELVKVLLYAGAHPEPATRNGALTPLHMASRAGNPGVIRELARAGSDVEARTTTGGATPLHFAAASGNAEAVKALLELGAEVDARDSAWEQTPLMWAAAYDLVEVMEVLLAAGADLEATSRVEDIAAREKADEEDLKERNRRMAVIWGLERSLEEAEEEARRNEIIAETGRDLEKEKVEERKPLSYGELVGKKGGLAPLHFAARQGNTRAVLALLEAGADIDRQTGGDLTSPLLIATINGHFDLAKLLLERGADPNLASDAGTTPLYAAINAQWAPKAAYPQPTAYQQQRTDYLGLMKLLLEAGADPNARLERHLWYMEYNFPRLNVDTWGATPFWRAAYGTDVRAMRLLVEYGADPDLSTRNPPEERRPGDEYSRPEEDPSGLPPVPVGGPGYHPLHAASGAGYGEGFGANAHRHAPDGWLPAVKYLVDELGVDVNVRDHNGYNAIHHAASRGDNELIRYLVSKGGDVTAVSRKGQTTADMANGPVQRTQPFPATVKLLESLGSKNNHNCMSC